MFMPDEISNASSVELLPVQEIAALLKVPVSGVYGHLRKRCTDRLPAYRRGKYWRFRSEEVLAWLQGHGEERRAV